MPTKPKPTKPKTKTLTAQLHHNSDMTQAVADQVALSLLSGQSLTTAGAAMERTPESARRYLRDIEVPLDYPEDPEAWRNDVMLFFRIAAHKLSRRLAREADEWDPRSVPVTLGIIVDKLAMMSGSPTQLSVVNHIHHDHRSLASKLIKPKAQVIDAKVVASPVSQDPASS